MEEIASQYERQIFINYLPFEISNRLFFRSFLTKIENDYQKYKQFSFDKI